MPDSGIMLALVSPKIPFVVNVRDCNPSQNSRLTGIVLRGNMFGMDWSLSFNTGKTLFYFGSGTFWESMNHWLGSNRNIPKQLSRLWFQSCFTLHCLETIPSWTIFQLGGSTTWIISTNNPQLYANMLGIYPRLSLYFILAEHNMKLVIFFGKRESPIFKPTCDSS